MIVHLILVVAHVTNYSPKHTLNAKAEVYMRAIDRYNVFGKTRNLYPLSDNRHFQFEFIKRAILNWMGTPTGISHFNMERSPIFDIASCSINYTKHLQTNFYIPDNVSHHLVDVALSINRGDVR